MAKFYGKNSSYLIKNDLKNYFYAVGLLASILIVALLLLKYSPAGVTLLFSILGVIFLLLLAEPIILIFSRKSNKFYSGFSGELNIRRELAKLPDAYSVFQDIIIGQNKGNIDFVVTGPSGIFMLEVKSHKGEVNFDGYDIRLNGRSFPENNIIRQVHGETWALKNYLQEQINSELFINSVLVFSSPNSYMHFGFNKIANMNIIQKDYLLELFERSNTIKYRKDLVDKALEKVVA